MAGSFGGIVLDGEKHSKRAPAERSTGSKEMPRWWWIMLRADTV